MKYFSWRDWKTGCAALTAEDRARLGLGALFFGLVLVLYHWQGNTTDIRMFGRSVFSWMFNRWEAEAEYQSHSWFVPLVSLGLLWWRRRQILSAPQRTDWRGFAVMAGALALHWMGARAQEPRLSLISFIVLLWGSGWFFRGPAVARELAFPCAYLLFCVPMSFLDQVTFPLRMLATSAAVAVLNGLGLAYRQDGSLLILGDIHLQVAPSCSGLNSILSMTAITAVYAYVVLPGVWRPWALFVCSIPLAILGNIARIVTVAMVAAFYNRDLAIKLYHDYSGFVFFPVAILAMMALGSLLLRLGRAPAAGRRP